MATIELIMPKLGESIMEATILKWHKQPGDPVRLDETVLEIATDKVDSDVPSTAAGVLEELLFKVNDVVPIGSVIATIRTSGEAEPGSGNGRREPEPDRPTGQISDQATKQATDRSHEQAADQPHEQLADQPHPQAPDKSHAQAADQSQAQSPDQSPDQGPNGSSGQPGTSTTDNGPAPRFYSPLVLNIAASEGVNMNELSAMAGTGAEGRVTKRDILQYLSDRKNGKLKQTNQTTPTPASVIHQSRDQQTPAVSPLPVAQPVATYSGNVEIIEMDRMRKLIAEHMVRSKHTSPHVTSFSEADVTNLVQWRDRVKKDFEKRENTRITFTPLFLEAITRCIKRFPMINSSLDGDRIIIKKDINIGMATALPSGNLIVPVIRNADQLNLVGLSRQVNGLADAARNGKLKADDTQNGTFTFTNVGTFGSLMGTPIINQPQVAIIAVGAIKKRPVVIETAQGDSIAIRHMMYLSMSYDHRVVDGSLGATFLTAVAKELENFDPNREF